MHPNQIIALRILGEKTKGHFCIWHLAGYHNAGIRRDLLSFLLGRGVTLAESGVNALTEHFHQIAMDHGMSGDDTKAGLDDNFEVWAKEQQS